MRGVHGGPWSWAPGRLPWEILHFWTHFMQFGTHLLPTLYWKPLYLFPIKMLNIFFVLFLFLFVCLFVGVFVCLFVLIMIDLWKWVFYPTSSSSSPSYESYPLYMQWHSESVAWVDNVQGAQELKGAPRERKKKKGKGKKRKMKKWKKERKKERKKEHSSNVWGPIRYIPILSI